jgi:hypothetical protein
VIAPNNFKTSAWEITPYNMAHKAAKWIIPILINYGRNRDEFICGVGI